MKKTLDKSSEYDHLKIEKKWQKVWDQKKVNKTIEDKKKKKCYVLDMFPYPSGYGLHVGHPRGYIASDVYARLMRMEGFNVLHPMGYDSFGLPAEQYAIANKIHPSKAVEKNIKTFRNQLDKLAFSFDWNRSVTTSDPKYYKWTQWIFLKLYESWYDKKIQKARQISELVKIFEKEGNSKIDASCDSDVIDFTAVEWKKMTELEKHNVLMKYRLTYEGFSEVNWCPKMGTVLANDEIVDGPDGKPVSERGGYPVEKKALRQWFMRITAYADRLISGLDTIDWSEHVKEIQRNWIGKSVGSEITFDIKEREEKIKVFTTRADTLFGVTYVVLAPECELVKKLWNNIENKVEVEKYITEVKAKTDEDRMNDKKEKTGIELKGIKAINPANNEEVPVFLADYVLASYGTGMVMAVPAHDDRDYAFAKRYNLPIKNVIIPKVIDECDPPKCGVETIERKAIQAIVIDSKTSKVLMLKWKKFPWTTFITGGVEEGEDIVSAANREIKEETGYKNIRYVRTLGCPVESNFYAQHKQVNRKAVFSAIVFELIDDTHEEISDSEKAIHELCWMSWDEIAKDKNVKCSEYKIWLDRFFNAEHPFVDDGVLMNSGKFDCISSEDAREQITKFVGGKIVTKYKMRDAVFARQRYWGEPIPLIHQKDGTIKTVDIKKLPLKLPSVKSYEPIGTGESPLAGVKEWVKKGYETNTMPGWAGSSWYFLRYMDPKNKKELVSKKANQYWKNVDMYVGGAEHATGHLLYSRFWNKFLFDYGLITEDEPFKCYKNLGMILGQDSRKMSKRWGNVINPDDVVKNVGADTLRVYECFMGPFDQEIAWSTDSMVGSRRFLDKIWKLQEKIEDKIIDGEDVIISLNQTIKKVGDDIKSFNFNTAISSMMIFVNILENKNKISKKTFSDFIKILSPFAPHICEEIWNNLGYKKLIVSELWPKYDEKKLVSSKIKIVVQINGKFRATIEIKNNSSEDDVKADALKDSNVSKWLEGKNIIKTIFVKNKIINFVI